MQLKTVKRDFRIGSLANDIVNDITLKINHSTSCSKNFFVIYIVAQRLCIRAEGAFYATNLANIK